MHLHKLWIKMAPNWRKSAMCKHFFFKANLFKEEMKKFVVLLTKEKQLRMNGKMISLTFLYSAYKISTILFFYLLICLNKEV